MLSLFIIITIIIIIIITITITALYIIYGNTTECIQSVAKRVTIKTRQERKQRFDVWIMSRWLRTEFDDTNQ